MSGPLLAATICRTLSAAYEPLAKRISLDGAGGFAVQGYGKALWFRFEPIVCADIVAFGRKLVALAKDPAAGVLRGAPLPHVRPGGCYHRRATHADVATNAIEDVPRFWIAVDCDDIPVPAGMPDWLRDIPGAARYLMQLLPQELHDVTCVVQVTGSGGFTGDGLLRLRLWFAVEPAVDSVAARGWAQAWNHTQGTRLIDWAPFSPVALHYVANPILGPGVASPVAGRWCLLRGTRDQATLVLPLAPPVHVSLTTTVVANAVNGSAATRRRSFSELVGLIGSVEHGFYAPLKAALGRAAADRQDLDATIAAVSAAVLQADPGHRDQATIKRYANRGFLVAAFNSFSRQDTQLRRANEQTHKHWFRRSGESGASVSQQEAPL